MGIWTIVILGISLSMDAFAVSICKGLALGKPQAKDCLKAALWFGIFQGLMPAAGYFAGSLFANVVDAFSSWIAFGLLVCVGANMIREALSQDEEKADAGMGAWEMFLMAIATSIDAAAVGVTFSVVPVSIVPDWSVTANTLLACLIICCETGVLSAIGIWCGSWLGEKFHSKAEIAGGIVLIFIGIRILASHYGLL